MAGLEGGEPAGTQGQISGSATDTACDLVRLRGSSEPRSTEHGSRHPRVLDCGQNRVGGVSLSVGSPSELPQSLSHWGGGLRPQRADVRRPPAWP